MNIRKALTAVGVGLGVYGSLLPGAGAQTLKIGVVAPLTGGGAPWGVAAEEATKIVASDVNAEGGLDVGGRRYHIQVIAYDDQYKAANAVAAYNRLVNQDGAKYVFLHTSPAAVALKGNVEDDQVVALTAAASPNAIDANTKYMFRINSTPDDYMPALVAWMADHIKQRRIVLVNPDDEVGGEFHTLAEKLFKQRGFDVVGNELYERDQQDFQPLFTKIIGLRPEVIDLGGVPPATAGLMVREARDLGYKGLFIKTAGPSPKDIVSAAGKQAAEGMIVELFADPANPGYQRIAARYKKDISQDPNEMIVICYDGVNVLLHAIEKAGTVNDTAKVAAAFPQALPMKSVQGDELTLGGKFDRTAMTTFYIGVIKNGEPVVIGKVQ